MKIIFKSFLLIAGVILAFSACRKFDSLPYYDKGTAPTLVASTTTVSATSADSASTVLTLSWTNPGYAIDSSTEKYVIEMDSSGRNFTHVYTKTVKGSLSAAFTASDMNAIAASLALKPDSSYKLDMRVKSSYGNNNELYTSNVVTVTVKPYIVPVTLKASSTSALALAITTASSTALSFTWSASQFGATIIYYSLQIDTSAAFKNPQAIQYGNVLSHSITQGDLNTALLNLGVTAGSTVNTYFRIAGYINAAYTQPAVYSNAVTVSVQTYIPLLYIFVPGAYQGWDPPTAPGIASTIPDLTAYEGYIYMPSSGDTSRYEFKITPQRTWDASYGTSTPPVRSSSDTNYLAGSMSLSGSNNLNVTKLGGGYFRIDASTSVNTWSANKTTWAVIGDATANGWGSDTPMTFDAQTQTWRITLNLSASGAFKFRANSDWGDPKHNFGIDSKGNLVYNAGNIKVPSDGSYTVILNLTNARQYTYSLQKN